MNAIVKIVGLMALLLVVSSGVVSGAEDYVQARVVKGSSITLKFRDVPDNSIDGEYYVDANDGTIKLPYLDNRVYVANKTQREVEDLVQRLYVSNEIYAHPIVTAVVGDESVNSALKARYIQVSGYVNSKKNLSYRPGITLIEAIIECGDISDFGSRYIQVSRNGQTRKYDYFSARDRAIQLRPKDVIFVPKRGFWEGRPDKVGP